MSQAKRWKKDVKKISQAKRWKKDVKKMSQAKKMEKEVKKMFPGVKKKEKEKCFRKIKERKVLNKNINLKRKIQSQLQIAFKNSPCK